MGGEGKEKKEKWMNIKMEKISRKKKGGREGKMMIEKVCNTRKKEKNKATKKANKKKDRIKKMARPS